MKKSVCLPLLLGILLAVLLSNPGFAQESGFNETFDGETLEGWETSEGVALREGVLRVNPGNFAMRFGRYNLGTLRVNVRPPGSGAVFLRFAMGEKGSYAVIIVEDRLIL